MGRSLKVLKMNFNKYYNSFYNYFLKALYYGAVPSIVLYGKHYRSLIPSIGLFSKPYSPLILAMWSYLFGEDQSQEDFYGQQQMPQSYY